LRERPFDREGRLRPYAFTAWTQSEHFRAHRDAGANRPLYLGRPEFEALDAIQTIKNSNGREQAARTATCRHSTLTER
jgi:hypothetical protein